MRIISGEFKGRKLMTPNDNRIRPTTDKVKEAVFSIIAAYIPEGVFLDLFSGTGNMGLEAISRGAKRAYFTDIDRRSTAIIRENVKHCRAEDRSVIMCADYISALNKIHDKVDVIFVDPPYKEGAIETCMQKISESDILASDGIIVAEHSNKDELPEELFGFKFMKKRNYGKISISIYEKSVS